MYISPWLSFELFCQSINNASLSLTDLQIDVTRAASRTLPSQTDSEQEAGSKTQFYLFS